MGEYRTSAHAVFDIKYHIVWTTKYRYKILRRRVAERARDLLRRNFGSGIGGNTCGRAGTSARAWARVDEDTIKKYIESQKWDDEDQGFTAPTEP